MALTDYHAKYLAYELTKRCASDNVEKLAPVLADAQVDLVRETKGTRDFLQLRSSEADKIRCGQQHFETLGVPFAVAVSADEV